MNFNIKNHVDGSKRLTVTFKGKFGKPDQTITRIVQRHELRKLASVFLRLSVATLCRGCGNELTHEACDIFAEFLTVKEMKLIESLIVNYDDDTKKLSNDISPVNYIVDKA